jgi:glutamine amidotransferase
MKLAVIASGIGNITSLVNALQAAGGDPVVAEDPAALQDADKVILPGVGAFPAAMAALSARGFVDAVKEHVLARGRPLLGICLGMQLLAEEGTEFETCPGFGFIGGRVVAIPRGTPPLRMPHMGWNDLTLARPSPLTAGLGPDRACYFVHSFHLDATDPEDVVATCDYGGPVTAMVRHGDVHGCQFHPEKSQQVGLRILGNFIQC